MFVEEYLADLRRERFRPQACLRYVRRCAALSREHAFMRAPTLRTLGVTGLVGFLALLAGAVAISLILDRRLALTVFLNTGLLLLLGLLWLAMHVKLLVDPAGRPLARINAANILTLSRLVSIPAILAFVAAGHTTLGLVTFLVAAATDVVDGWLARHLNDATLLGRVFDPLVDIFFNASIMVALQLAGYLPGWVLALVLTRYGLLLFGAAAIYIFRGPVEIKPTVLGKATGVVTTLLVFVLVAGALLLPRETYQRIWGLLVVAVGFVEAITIPQVILIGWFNFKKAAWRTAARASIDTTHVA